MARLFEYQTKELLKKVGIAVPKGKVCENLDEIETFCSELGKPVVIKAQVWFTGRAAVGGIHFADSPAEAVQKAETVLGKTFRNFTVTKILVEEKLDIVREMFCSVIISDTERGPVVIFSSKGGSGVEEIAAEHPEAVVKKPVNITTGLRDYEAVNLIRKLDLTGRPLLQVGQVLVKLVNAAKQYEARSVEINPVVLTADGKVYAADARMTVDDYAVFRHPELGISYARELDNPPSPLDILAYSIEEHDYRGTFYFIQLERGFQKSDNVIGFHGAGGGGSMMSMDAVQRRGYTLANFCDTSGNPPASKVYRAARIILAQKNIVGYFGSGSGVASQEQVQSARGLVKAFIEENLSVPAVVRLGGNLEKEAVEILEGFTKHLPAPVEGYTKDDSADFCAERIHTLINEFTPPEKVERPSIRLKQIDYEFETMTGKVQFDYRVCAKDVAQKIVDECPRDILKLENDKPVLDITPDDAKKGKCIECLACELAGILENGERACYVDLPVEELDEIAEKSQ
ncbi:ATP-grasp domain-containing protein [candidate division KSB1 bacterium]